MRVTTRLVQVAAVLVAAAAAVGCGGSTGTGAGGHPGDAGPGDAGPDGVVGCGGCGCGNNPPQMVTLTAAQACQILEETYPLGTAGYGATCNQVCSYSQCELPQSYVTAVEALNPDAGPTPTDGGPRTLDCPTSPANVTISCVEVCTGRLTEGYRAPGGADGEGERLAAMAYLEAVSVHAFERLERELDAHMAPPTLLRAARRARRDEVRHTAMTTRLARRHGASPRLPESPAPARARSLFEVALENAVEGCIRETYGAVQGLVEAQTSRDAT